MSKLVPKPNPDEIVPGSTESRDETTAVDWFPIFRSGKYPQGDFSSADLDEICEEFSLTGRRPPVVFDHLTPDDYTENAKPGAAAGFIVGLRAVDETDPRYPGERLLEAQAKVNYSAVWNTREGLTRNCSAAFYKCAAAHDKKKRFALHHLALLGAAPPGVNGLPEVVFRERDLASRDEILRFDFEDGIPAPSTYSAGEPTTTRSIMGKENPDTISFGEHKATLESQESKLRLEFAEELNPLKAKSAELESQLASFREQVSTLTAEKASLENEKALFGEQQRAIGLEEGKNLGRQEAEANFSQTSRKTELSVYCENLRKSGRLTEAEFKGDEAKGLKPMADRLFAMPDEIRSQFCELLDSRPSTGAELRTPEHPFTESAMSEEDIASAARSLASEKNISFREARAEVIRNNKKGT